MVNVVLFNNGFYGQDIVMAFSPPEYCRLFAQRRPTTGGSRAPQDSPPPSYASLKEGIFSFIKNGHALPRILSEDADSLVKKDYIFSYNRLYEKENLTGSKI